MEQRPDDLAPPDASPEPGGTPGFAAVPRSTDLPPDGVPTPVAPASVRASVLGSLIVSTILLLGLLALVVASIAFQWWPGLPVWPRAVAWALVAGLFLWLSIAWPGIEYRYLRYSVQDVGLVIWRGVVWRKVISVPRSRVQHTDVSQGPIQRRFGLGTLTMHTAGTEHAAITLEGLSHRTALALRDFLLEGRGEELRES